MNWLKGLIFVVIALTSLAVALLWPHQQQKKTLYASTTEPLVVTSKQYGLPMQWLDFETTGPYPIELNYISTYDAPLNKESRKYNAQNLLINLICWGVFLVLVTFGFRFVNRVSSK